MSRYSSPALRQQIRSQFGDRCAYCQTAEALTVSTFEIEQLLRVRRLWVKLGEHPP